MHHRVRVVVAQHQVRHLAPIVVLARVPLPKPLRVVLQFDLCDLSPVENGVRVLLPRRGVEPRANLLKRIGVVLVLLDDLPGQLVSQSVGLLLVHDLEALAGPGVAPRAVVLERGGAEFRVRHREHGVHFVLRPARLDAVLEGHLVELHLVLDLGRVLLQHVERSADLHEQIPLERHGFAGHEAQLMDALPHVDGLLRENEVRDVRQMVQRLLGSLGRVRLLRRRRKDHHEVPRVGPVHIVEQIRLFLLVLSLLVQTSSLELALEPIVLLLQPFELWILLEFECLLRRHLVAELDLQIAHAHTPAQRTTQRARHRSASAIADGRGGARVGGRVADLLDRLPHLLNLHAAEIEEGVCHGQRHVCGIGSGHRSGRRGRRVDRSRWGHGRLFALWGGLFG
mmetsp:Transcript_34380/g.79548  ORF Transcript_34380/g.79548 Transcript_34380/m.79548 type:complete len:397 (+) Transcript_34380:7331-8521(+)